MQLAKLCLGAALAAAMAAAGAQEAAKPVQGGVEKNYQVGDASPVGQAEMHHNMNNTRHDAY